MANRITFDDEIDDITAADFVAQMDAVMNSAKVSIDTPGGDIFAGGRMVNAVERAVERGCTVSFELGSCVASMGAAMVAAAKARGCHVVARANTQMMFHGCYGGVVGGAEELRDSAKCMENFNRSVIDNLKSCGIEDCEGWFAAGRETWIGATELLEIGLVDAIAGSDARGRRDYVSVANRFAAKWSNHMEEDEKTTKEVETQEATAVAEVSDIDEKEPAEVVTDDESAETVKDEAQTISIKDCETRVAGMQAAMQKQVNDLKVQLGTVSDELTAAKATITSLKDRAEKAESELRETASALEAKTNALAELNARVNAPCRKSDAEILAESKDPAEREAIRAKMIKDRIRNN